MNQQPEILPPSETIPDMPRADTPAIWEDYRAQLAKLKATAETLTVTDVSQKAEMKLARELRLAFKSLRCEIENTRKERGEYHLRATQKINGDAKQLKDFIEPFEARLLEQENFAAVQEEKRKNELGIARTAELTADGFIANCYDLREMPEQAYADLIFGLKAAKTAREEAAKKEEAERVEKEREAAAERERMRVENERLRKEAAEKEAALLAERQRVEAERAKEREAADAKLKAEREQMQREAREQAEAERQERLKEQAAREVERQKAEAAAAKENARLAGIAEAQRQEAARATAELARKKAAEVAAAAQAVIKAGFDNWWREEGSAMRPLESEDAPEHVHRVAGIAWANGAFKSQEASA